MKNDPNELLEDGGTANDAEKALKSVGIQLRDSQGEFRDLDIVLDELGATWENLTRNQKAYLATTLAGSRQSSRFLAIMNNYDRTLELIATSQNSVGAAMSQYAIYEDSAAAAQNRLTAEVEKFQVSLTSSENIKIFTGWLTGIVEIGNTLGPVITILIAAISALGISFTLSTSKIYGFTVAQEINKISTLDNAYANGVLNATHLVQQKGLTGLLTKVAMLIVARKGETAAALDAAGATAALNLATGGAVIVIGLLVAGIAAFINYQQERARADKEAYASAVKLAETRKTEANNLDSSIKRYEELSNKIITTTAEKEELITIQNDLASTYPNLIAYIDEETNAHLKNIEVLKEEAKARNEASFDAAKQVTATRDTVNTNVKVGTADLFNPTLIEEYSEQAQSLFTAIESEYEKLTGGTGFGSTVLLNINKTPEEMKKILADNIAMTGEKDLENLGELIELLRQQVIQETLNSTEEAYRNFTISKQQIENSNAPSYIASALISSSTMAFDQLREEVELMGADDARKYIGANSEQRTEAAYQRILDEVGTKGVEIQSALENIANLSKSGASVKLIDEAYKQLFEDYEITDQMVKDNFKTVSSGFTYTEEIAKKLNQGDFLYGMETNAFNEYGQKALEWIGKGIDSAAPELKDQLREEFKTIATDPELLDAFTKIFDSTDFTSPTSVDQLYSFLTDSVGMTTDAVDAMIGSVSFELSTFMESIKKGFAALKQIASDMKKSLSGEITMEDAIDMMQPEQYGPGAIETVDGEFFLSTQSIENKRRVEENKMISDSIAVRNDYLKKAADITAHYSQYSADMTDSIKEEIEYNEAMAESIQKTIDAMMELTDAELAVAQNQNVLDAVGAINTSLESLSSYGDLFERLTSGSMGLLEIMTTLGTNPELIQALDVQNGQLVFQQEALIGIARAKKNEVSQYLTGELKKLEAVQANIDAMIAGKDVNEDAAMSNLDALGAQEEGMITLSNKTIEAVNQENVAKMTAATVDSQTTQAFLDNAEKKINAQVALNQAIKGGVPVLGKINTGNASKAAVSNSKTKGVTSNGGDFWSEIGNYYGIDGGNANNKEAISKANKAQIEKYKALIAEWNDIDPETLLTKGKSKSGGGEDAFESYLATFDKFFNFIRKIEELTKEASKLQAQIDLKATDGFEDIELMKEQAQGYANKAAALTQYNKALTDEADAKRKSMKEKYGSFVDFDANGKLIANTQAINNINIDSEEKEKWFEGLEQGIEDYNDLTDKIDDNTEALLANQKALEDMYDAIRDEIIDTSDAIYQALLENDKKAVQDAEEKFNKLKQLEDDYLSAVKTAIDKERKMRSKTAAEAELVKEQRKLAVLKRDTSGSSAKAIMESENRIASMKTNLEDSRIDDQISALEEQISLAQQQRDLQIQNLNALIQFKEENGLYWQQVDQTIAAGPAAIVAALQSTDTYLNASKLEQTKLAEDMTKQAETLSAVFNSGKSILGVNDVDVQLALATGLASITQAVSNLGAITSGGGTASSGGSTGGASGGGSSGGGSSGGGSSPITSTPSTSSPTLNPIAMLQTLLNKEFNAGLVVDGITGKKTKQAMDGLIARAAYGPNSRNITETQRKDLIASMSTAAGNNGKGRMSKFLMDFISAATTGFSGYESLPKYMFAYKNGGLADYTGPAWVDGTRSRPEAFLNPDQTELVSSLVRGLENRSSDIMGASISLGEINVYVSNTNATAQDIGAAVRNEILKTFNGRTNLSITKNR